MSKNGGANSVLMTDLFSHIDTKTIKRVFSKHHVSFPANFSFSSVNIIIGPNGSGKTRFLHAIKELYELDNNKNILYGYFPSLSDHKSTTHSKNNELPEWTLYESIHVDDVNFSDFFKEIELHNEEFIPELLVFHSRTQKARGDKALKIVQDSFLMLTKKQLIVDDSQIYVKDGARPPETLSSALNLLSPGELILFYMSIFLSIQQNGKKNKVIILDEPESHLHPKALLEFIKLLTNSNEYEEIWIATHSLFIIPEFKFENIVYINNSKVNSRKSKVYQEIFIELLGDEDKKIQTFFSSLSQWQYCEFIAECFTQPNVVSTINPHDEQVQLFLKYFNEHRPFRILDCGGGSGRLGLSLEAAKLDMSKDINYYIFDREPSYVGNEFIAYKNLKDINESFNCVVMMNFLHEVDPGEWENLFHRISSLMEKDSYLLFVEVMALSQGEMPNNSGYFVLGEKELAVLFNSPKKLSFLKISEAQKSIAVLVPCSLFSNICQKSIYYAIKTLENRMLQEIKSFRKSNSKSSRYYAFLLQQYINAKLFLDVKESIQISIVQKSETASEENPKILIDQYGARPISNTSMKQSVRATIWSVIMSSINESRAKLTAQEFPEAFFFLYDSINYYQETSVISSEQLKLCWDRIQMLEENHASKELIAIFSAALLLMGDPYGENKLKDNRYSKYFPSKLKSLLI